MFSLHEQTNAFGHRVLSQGHRVLGHEQTNAFGQAAFGPGMGAIASIYGLRYALVGVALLLVPPQIIYAFAKDAPRDDRIFTHG